MFDIVELKESLPKQHRSKITPQFVTELNQLCSDPDYGELYSKNVLTYASVLQEGRFKLVDYFNAVAFVSYKMLGMGNMAAYQKVFPQKVKDMVNRNVSNKDMQAYASTYNKTKLVSLIYEQTLIPDHIMYASVRHKSIARLAHLMENAKCERDQVQAAATLLKELKAPEEAKLNIDIAATDSGVIADLANALSNLSGGQRERIIEGSLDAKTVAHTPILMGGGDNE